MRIFYAVMSYLYAFLLGGLAMNWIRHGIPPSSTVLGVLDVFFFLYFVMMYYQERKV